jgi:hypothetical protein
MDTKHKIIAVIGAIALIAIIGIGGFVLFATPDSDVAVPSQGPAQQ